jgi:hypothetical protein
MKFVALAGVVTGLFLLGSCGSATSGPCVECSHACAEDEARCADYRECGDFDPDEAFEWGPLIDCGVDEICVDGACEAS